MAEKMQQNTETTEKKILKRFTLSFHSDELNKKFLTRFNNQNVKLIRITLLIGAFLYIVFGFLDKYLIPDAADKIFIIRVFCTVFLLAMFSISSRFAAKHVQLITFLASLISGIGIVLMILISEASGSYYYYAGLLLVIWYAHGPLRMRFVLAAAVSLILTISYELAVLFFKTTPLEIVMNNTFFIVSANILGMFSSYGLEYYSRIAFWREEQISRIRTELESEYLRKSKELEDARQIQLSLLPPCVTNIFDLDICFEMRTAAEVGGDYYDYKVFPEDASITMVLGDATSHGMKAGILVSIIKSLFMAFKDGTDFNTFLNNCSGTIKSMRLGNLFMSLLILKYSRGHICFSAAGMPPVLIYRSDTNQVERITIKGIPLGAFEAFDYKHAEAKINPGDVVLLMTDGYPELFNRENETLDYNRVEEIFCRTDKTSATGIMRQLFEEGDKWRGGKVQHDDISFIVFKRKGL